MSQVEVTPLVWAGKNLRRTLPRSIETDDIVARAETSHYAVLYLRSGEKLIVKETLSEIERLASVSGAQRETVKRFKREMRECKAMGMSVDQAFAVLWEQTSTELTLSQDEEASLYQELLDWTKRWLK